MRLCSRAYLDTEQSGDAIKLAWLDGEAGGPIALSGGRTVRSIAIGAGPSRVQSRCAGQRLFGDRLYVELQRHGMAAGGSGPALVGAAAARGLPLVATNGPFFAA